MNTFINLLAVESDTDGVIKTAYDTFMSIVNTIMPIAIAILLIFGIAYGIILGIKFAKAEDTDARDKAKQQLINMIIGVVVALVITAIIYIVLGSGWIKSLFPDVNPNIDSAAAGA